MSDHTEGEPVSAAADRARADLARYREMPVEPPWSDPFVPPNRWFNEPNRHPKGRNDLYGILSAHALAIECSSDGPDSDERAEVVDELIQSVRPLVFEIEHLRAEQLDLRQAIRAQANVIHQTMVRAETAENRIAAVEALFAARQARWVGQSLDVPEGWAWSAPAQASRPTPLQVRAAMSTTTPKETP